MDAGLGEQQKVVESSDHGIILSAQQFYQHDPLLVLLKDTLHLSNLWIIAGAIVFPGGDFLLWWLLWASKVRLWIPGNTVTAVLQVFIMLCDALLLIAGLVSSNFRWFSPVEILLLGAIYLVLTPSLLIGWLVFPHRVMLRARDE